MTFAVTVYYMKLGKSMSKTSLSTLSVFRFFRRPFRPLRKSASHHILNLARAFKTCDFDLQKFKNFLFYTVSCQIFRTFRSAVKEEGFAPYCKILNYLQISTISQKSKLHSAKQHWRYVLKNSEASENTQI